MQLLITNFYWVGQNVRSGLGKTKRHIFNFHEELLNNVFTNRTNFLGNPIVWWKG